MSKLEFLGIQELMEKGDFNHALKSVNKFLNYSEISKKEELALLCLKSKIISSMGNYNESIELAKEIREEAQKQKNNLYVIDALNEEIFGNYRLNNIEEALRLIRIAETKIDQIKLPGFDERRAQLLVNKVYIFTDSGDIGQAFASAQENYTISQKIVDKSHLARAYYTLGWVQNENGEIDQAIKNFQKSLELREKIGNQQSLAYTLFILGFSWLKKGKLDLAEEYILRSLKIREKIDNKQDVAWTLLNLGDIEYGKNNFKEAQNYYEKSLLINDEIGYKLGIIFSLMRLCLIYENVDNPQLVTDTLEKALYYSHEIENIDAEANVLFNLIHFATKRKLASNSISDYLEKLHEISNQYSSKTFNQIYRLAKALVLKNSTDQKDIKKAHEILQHISDEEIVNYLYTRIAMINYSEILAAELKIQLGDDHLIIELTELSDSISPLQFQQSYTFVFERFLYQSKSALAEIDIAKARELLKRAQFLSDFLDLYKKGPTPFRIIYTLFIKERSLGELSEILNLTKGALTTQIKILTNLGLVKVSRERQVRSATILKKYYQIGSNGLELIKSFNANLVDNLNDMSNLDTSKIITMMIPRLITKMIMDSTDLISEFHNFLDEQILSSSYASEIATNEQKQKLQAIKSIFKNNSEIRINQLFLTDEQYKIYLNLWKEFNQKVQEQIIKAKTNSSITDEKSNYITHISMPLKELMTLEMYQNKLRKIKGK